ncbi:MAG: hypothetical protein IT443_05450 [Phycisphaeraceae bacterium]|nr:hypothetical protein [Phycisphaeraceae bacterium]
MPSLSTRFARVALSLCAALVLSLLSLPSAAQTLPSALNMVPADASVVILAPNLQLACAKIDQLYQRLNLAGSTPDILAQIKQTTGFNAGLNDQGSVLIVLDDLQPVLDGSSEPPVLLLLPVANYQAFLNNFPPAPGSTPAPGSAPGTTPDSAASDASNSSSAIRMPDGEIAYCRKLDSYALLSPSQELVDKYQPGPDSSAVFARRLGALATQYSHQADLQIFLNLERLGPQAIAMIDNQIASDPSLANPTSMNQVQARFGIMVIKTILRDASAASINLHLSDTGIGLTFCSQLKPNSPLAKRLTTGSSASSYFRYLPQGDYLLASAYSLKGIDFRGLLDDLSQDSLENNASWFAQAMQITLPLIEQAKGGAVVATLSPVAMANPSNPLVSLSVTESLDGQAYHKAWGEVLQKMQTLEIPLDPIPTSSPSSPAPTPATQPILHVKAVIKPNALQVAGRSVDHFIISPLLPENYTPSRQNLSAFTAQEGYMAVVGNYILTTNVPDPILLRRGLDNHQTGPGLAADAPIQAVRKLAVAPNASAEAYLNLRGLENILKMFLTMFGITDLSFPADLPPIAMSLELKDSAIAQRIFVPIQLLDFAGQTVQKFHDNQQKMIQQRQMQQSRPTPGTPGSPGNPGSAPANK